MNFGNKGELSDMRLTRLERLFWSLYWLLIAGLVAMLLADIYAGLELPTAKVNTGIRP